MIYGTKLIGISGKAGSGKDTLAEELCNRHGFMPLAFAGKLKEICAEIFSINICFFNDRHLKNVPHTNLCFEGFLTNCENLKGAVWVCNKIMSDLGVAALDLERATARFISEMSCRLPDSLLTPRQTLQLVSDVLKQIAGNECLLNECMRNVQLQLDQGHSVVLTDVRYEREINALIKLDALMVGITRNTCEQHNLSSEQEVEDCLKKCAVVFKNDGNVIKDFTTSALSVIERWSRENQKEIRYA